MSQLTKDGWIHWITRTNSLDARIPYSLIHTSKISMKVVTSSRPMTHIWVNKLCHGWFSKWLAACSMLSHQPNQCRINVNCTCWYKFQSILKQCTSVSMQENVFKMSSIKYQSFHLGLSVLILYQIHVASLLGPVSLRLMTSQFKDIITHTQK